MAEITLQTLANALNEMIKEHNDQGEQIKKLGGLVQKLIAKQNTTAKIVVGLKSDITSDLTEVDGRLRKIEASYSPAPNGEGATTGTPTFTQTQTTSQAPSVVPADAVVDGEVTDSDDDPFFDGGE